MSQEQQEQPQEQTQKNEVMQSNEPDGTTTPSTPRKVKKRVVKKGQLVNVEALVPRPSYWPIALAFSVVMFLYGAIGNEIIMGIGALLVIVCVIGWGMERR